jgi:hypothetical protein
MAGLSRYGYPGASAPARRDAGPAPRRSLRRPAWPYNLVPYLIVAWTIAGVSYFFYIRSHRTDMLDAMGRVWEPAAS